MSSKELIMSKGKYPSIFLKPNGGIVFIIILQIFFATHIWGYSPVLCERKYLMNYNNNYYNPSNIY